MIEILENSQAGKLSKFHIAKDNVFTFLSLGPGFISTDPEETRSNETTQNKNCRFLSCESIIRDARISFDLRFSKMKATVFILVFHVPQ